MGLKLDPFQGQVWAETWGPNKRLRRKLSVEALGAGTDLRNLSVVSLRRTAFARRGARPTLSAPLSAAARVARSEAERAGPETCQIRQPPRFTEAVSNAGTHFYHTAMYSAPDKRLSAYGGTVSPDPRTCPNLPKRAGFGHKAPFLLTVNGRLSPPKSRPNGRLAPTRACGRSLFGAT